MNFDLKEFSYLNKRRCYSSSGFNHNVDVPYLLICLSAELGEIAGIHQKLIRGYNKREQKKTVIKWNSENSNKVKMSDGHLLETYWRESLIRQFREEIADLFTYLDLIATHLGIDLAQAVVEKFNRVCDEMECPEFKYKDPSQEYDRQAINK